MKRLLMPALFLLAALAGSARAADDTQNPTSAPADTTSQANEEPQDQLLKAAATESGSGWIFGGGLVATDPGYVGYTRQITPFPLVFYHYGRFFFAGISAGYLLSNGDHYRFSLVISPELNRLKASDSPQLAGIQSRQWSLDGGANLEFFGDWGRFNLGVTHDLLDRNNGTGASTSYHYSFHAGSWSITPGLGLRWENSNLTDYYYGVSPAEAIPGRPAYSPGAATNPFVEIGVGTALTEHLWFRGNLQYMRFGSAIHDSPIVDRSGSPTIFIGLIYNPHDRPLGGP